MSAPFPGQDLLTERERGVLAQMVPAPPARRSRASSASARARSISSFEHFAEARCAQHRGRNPHGAAPRIGSVPQIPAPVPASRRRIGTILPPGNTTSGFVRRNGSIFSRRCGATEQIRGHALTALKDICKRGSDEIANRKEIDLGCRSQDQCQPRRCILDGLARYRKAATWQFRRSSPTSICVASTPTCRRPSVCLCRAAQ